jgi:hypothetical protein
MFKFVELFKHPYLSPIQRALYSTLRDLPPGKNRLIAYGGIASLGPLLLRKKNYLMKKYTNGMEAVLYPNWIKFANPIYDNCLHGQSLGSYSSFEQEFFWKFKIASGLDQKLTFGQVRKYHTALEEIVSLHNDKYGSQFKIHILGQDQQVDLFTNDYVRLTTGQNLNFQSRGSAEETVFLNAGKISRAPILLSEGNRLMIANKEQDKELLFRLKKSYPEELIIPTRAHEEVIYRKHPDELKWEMHQTNANRLVILGLGYSASWAKEELQDKYGIPLAFIANPGDKPPRNPRNEHITFDNDIILRKGDERVIASIDKGKNGQTQVQFYHTDRDKIVVASSILAAANLKPHVTATRAVSQSVIFPNGEGRYHKATNDVAPDLNFFQKGTEWEKKEVSPSKIITTKDVPIGSLMYATRSVGQALGINAVDQDSRPVFFFPETYGKDLLEKAHQEGMLVDIQADPDHPDAGKYDKYEKVFKEHCQELCKELSDGKNFATHANILRQAFLKEFPDRTLDAEYLVKILAKIHMQNRQQIHEDLEDLTNATDRRENLNPPERQNEVVLGKNEEDDTRSESEHTRFFKNPEQDLRAAASRFKDQNDDDEEQTNSCKSELCKIKI